MPQLVIENLKKTYTYGMAEPVAALRGVDFTVEEGESVAIMGPSGAGKSTLLQIVGALDKATSGKILFKGANMSAMVGEKLAAFRNANVGFVFQFHHLLPEFSAVENVMMPLLIGGASFVEAKAKALDLLDRVSLKDRGSHRPGELSGGEQQRVAVARAAILEPALILADEPTGNLDLATGAKVFDLLLELNREKKITLMVVTHSEALAERMGRSLRMADGKLVGDGGRV